MAILNIEKFENPVLRKKAERVKEINEEIEKLVRDMIDTMMEYKGIGLAANQVGVLKRVIVVLPDPSKSEVFAFINPKVIKKSREKSILEEGCLSFPNMFFNISRPKEIEVEGFDIKGDKIQIQAKGIAAHVFQHEIDHLDGFLFFDRLSFAKKIRMRLKNLWR